MPFVRTGIASPQARCCSLRWCSSTQWIRPFCPQSHVDLGGGRRDGPVRRSGILAIRRVALFNDYYQMVESDSGKVTNATLKK